MSRIRNALETRSQIVSPGPQWTTGDITGTTGWGPGMVWRGGHGNPTDNALRLSAVYACIRIISEAIATLPLDAYRRQGGVRRPVRPRPQWMDFEARSRIDYFSQIVLSLLTDGNAYVYLVYDAMGDLLDLIVLDPSQMQVSSPEGRVEYRFRGQKIDPYELMHIPGMKLPGHLTGLNPIAYARESIDLGLATQRFGAAYFENGALPGAVITAPGKFDDDAANRFKAMWNDRHQGIGNAHRVGVLTEGATIDKVSISPEDSQFLETRQFQVPDIARIFGVPPHLIADASNSTSWGSGLAEQNQSFGQYTLRGWCERIEEAHTRLMPRLGLPDVFVKLNLDALLRATLSERYASYAVGIENEFLLPNEARSYEDLPPIAGGDKFAPKQMVAKEPMPTQTADVPPAPVGGAA